MRTYLVLLACRGITLAMVAALFGGEIVAIARYGAVLTIGIFFFGLFFFPLVCFLICFPVLLLLALGLLTLGLTRAMDYINRCDSW